ncbi:FkbM family methyltransferase [Azohydromonas lata]|uniref:FkbM family methyltransferase n=1 Tax=Azohydromonas lata TaxID=45677 RepID=A0ABU5IJJ9_9BURK|nr:FkbM family methyltransferase [Azohydromonas lata]MDZ5459075.1 FkbM family methyltransferase [Azohydromonas lata]
MSSLKARVVAAQTSHGILFVYENDKPIADALKLYGEWAGIEIDFLQQFIPASGVVIDAGCHVGLHSVAMVEGRPGLTVHAFEPQPALLELAARNLECGHARSGARMVLHPCALGAQLGQVFMPGMDFLHPTNAGASQVSQSPLKDGIAVEISTLDSQELTPVSFMKFDLEGYEGAALQGARQLIARDRPVLFCEINDLDGAARILEALRGFEYQAYFVETAAFNPDNYRGESDNIFGHACETALLMLPPGRPAPARRSAAVLQPVSSLEALARLLLETPRYGDATTFDRKPQRLREEMQRQHAIQLQQQVAAQAELSRQQAKAEVVLARQRAQAKAAFDAAQRAAEQAARQAAEQMAVLNAQRLHMTRELARNFPKTVSKRWTSQVAWLLGLNPLARDCRRLALSGLFDRRWYRNCNQDVATQSMHPLVHYLLYGAYEGRNPNRVFDSGFYLARNPDVRGSGINPLLHYIKHGEAEGRAASDSFEPNVYLAQRPWLKERRFWWQRSPLRHFLRRGKPSEVVLPAYRPPCPDWAEFERLPKPLPLGADAVDVIVPVYRGYDDTFACLLSVMSSRNRSAFELIVIDDCSPDPKISADLQRLADRGLFTLLRNEKNLGFVGTVNRGMALHPQRDVLLLNSDTLVFNDWLDRIRAHAQAPGARIASVTPFTNNGTICSYPFFCKDNSALLETGYAQLDQLAAAVNAGQHVEVPTGVGFCMYIARAALNEVGLFDVESFGAGYGEENDFCQRALKAGWRNVHALDAFVFHSGETSFAEGASAGKSRGYKTLLRLHPDYAAQVKRYIQADPACYGRIALDISRAFGRPVRPLVLCFTHAWGGGIERHLRERQQLLEAQGRDLLVLTPASAGTLIAQIAPAGQDGVLHSSNLAALDLAKAQTEFCKAIKQLGVHDIELHSTVSWSVEILSTIKELSAQLGVPYTVTLHDYVSVCPQVTLINESGRYCGELGVEQCRSCLRHKPERLKEIHPDCHDADIEHWRANYRVLLEGAQKIIVPSPDTGNRFQRYFPQMQFQIQPHTELPAPECKIQPNPLCDNDRVRVALIGAIGPHKGSRVLWDCAQDALVRNLPLHFVVIGYTDLPELEALENVTVTGKYQEEEVCELLALQKPHVIFLPSVWPETFCYTLSIAMHTDLPIAVFDIGAQAERLEDYSGALRLPLSLIDTPEHINDKLMALARAKYCSGVVAGATA